MNCPNCGNTIGCACSGGSALRVASDGTQVCTKCIDAYENSLKAALQQQTNINEA